MACFIVSHKILPQPDFEFDFKCVCDAAGKLEAASLAEHKALELYGQAGSVAAGDKTFSRGGAACLRLCGVEPISQVEFEVLSKHLPVA